MTITEITTKGTEIAVQDERALLYHLMGMLKKVTRNKSSFPDDDSIYKVMYLAIKNASAKWTMPIKEWGMAVNQFAILFEGRFPLC